MISVLIRFEGPQGSGKTRLATMIEGFLQASGFSTLMLEDTHTMSVIEMPTKQDSSQNSIAFEKINPDREDQGESTLGYRKGHENE